MPGNYSPPTTASRVGAVLVILQSKVLHAQLLYYHFVVGLPGHGQVVCPWHLSSYLVGNYTPPTTVATCNPVLVIPPSVEGTIA